MKPRTGNVFSGALATAAVAALFGVLLASGTVHARDLRVNVESDPSMVDPITFSELIAGDIIDGNIYEGFTGIDKDGNVVPLLAERWTVHDDTLGFRFHLRKGVKFHSGREFGAKDVKYYFEQLLLPGNKGGLNVRYLVNVVGAKAVQDGDATELEGVTVVDQHTVDVRFTSPDVLFPIYPFMFMDSGIVDEHGKDWHTKVSAGTGPYKFAHWNLGSEVRLATNDDYWGGRPGVDGVTFLIVQSDDTVMSMYEADEIDVVYLDPAAARRVLTDDRFSDEVRLQPAAQIRYMGMNQNLYPPFKDIRVREAVCRAIDYQGMIKGLYAGAAYPLYGQITPGVAGHNPDLPAITYDAEEAKRLMAEAGYPDGEGLPPIKVTSTARDKAELAYYANQFNDVLGMPVEVQVMERGTFIKRMNAGEVAFFPWGWTAGYPDGLYFLSQVWYGKSRYNRARWQNDEFDALIEEATTTADAEARYKMYHQAEKVLLDDWGTCPLPARMQIALVKPNVDGVHLTSFRWLPFYDAAIK